jgi:hypothetical protein
MCWHRLPLSGRAIIMFNAIGKAHAASETARQNRVDGF